MAKRKSAKQPKIVKPTTNNDLVLNQLKEIGKDKKKKIAIPNNIKSVSSYTTSRIRNNESIVELFPDIELSIQILTSSILAPNNMLGTALTLESQDIPVPIGVTSALLSTVDSYLKTNYKIRDELPTILRESLFTKGAYIKAIIPQTSIDSYISKTKDNIAVGTGISMEELSTELFDKENGFLGESSDRYDVRTGLSTESKDSNISITNESELNVTITDDYDVLSLTSISKQVLPDMIKDKLGIETVSSMLKQDKKKIDVVTITADDENKKDIASMPLVIKLPVESVIPVHVSGEPENHMGYFVLLDNKGTPIVNGNVSSFEQGDDLNKVIINNAKSNIIEKAKKSLKGITKKAPVLEDLENIYTSILYKKLSNKLKNGIFGDLVSIDEKNDLFRIVFNRTLRELETKILFIPSELVAYYAFEYRDNGTGKSMLEKVSTLFSMRSILLFSKLMASVKNNTTLTKVEAKIDDDDPEPDVTKEKIISEVLKSSEMRLPIGVTDINDITEWIHKLGYSFNISSPGLPDTTIDINESSPSKTVPDDTLDEDIQEFIVMSFGLTKEMVKSGYDPEFATVATANNLLLAKRVMQLQNILTPKITKHITILLNNDGLLKNKLAEIIEKHIASIRKKLKPVISDEYVYILKNDPDAKLPKPEVNESTSMKDAFDDYTSNLDDYLDLLFSTDALPDDLLGDLSDKIDSIKAAIKTTLVKRWMNENNYMPELNQFLSINDDGEPTLNLLSEYNEYIESFATAIMPFIKINTKNITKINKKYAKATSDEPEEDTSTDDTASDDSTDTGDTTTDNTEQNSDLGGDNGNGNTDDQIS